MKFSLEQLKYVLGVVQRMQEETTDRIRFKSELQIQLCNELDKRAKETTDGEKK
jgi:hypothetical protein